MNKSAGNSNIVDSVARRDDDRSTSLTRIKPNIGCVHFENDVCFVERVVRGNKYRDITKSRVLVGSFPDIDLPGFIIDGFA